jgi:predicted XRE-type DNA-binding protein
LSQTEAAKVFGVTQPRISNLMRGKIEVFGLDMLVNMLSAAGLRVTVQVKKAA